MGEAEFNQDLSTRMSKTRARLDSAEPQEAGLPGILLVTPDNISEAHTGMRYSRMVTRHVTYFPASTIGRFTLTLKTHVIFQGTGYSAQSEIMSRDMHEKFMRQSSFHPKEQERFLEECRSMMDVMEKSICHYEDRS